jgi:zinc/manganese transport system ATP-binding protein
VTAIALNDVTIAFNARRILSAVTLTIEDGEFVAMLGANGSGKTTLIRAILGLVPIQSGTIEVLGRPASRGNAQIGYLPQLRGDYAPVRFSGRDFVASAAGGHRWGLPVLNARERAQVDWALEIAGAEKLANRPLDELSGGERQRIFLSQALLGRPRLLLLDEPLISLDPTYQREVVETVRRLQKELKIAVVFSAHELNPLLNSIDRVLYLGGSRAVVGSVEEVINGPTLSRLYGSEIEVIRVGGRIFVMAGEFDLDSDPHRHERGEGPRSGHEHRHV